MSSPTVGLPHVAGAKRAQLYHQLTLAHKVRKAPRTRLMCANLTPFEQICTCYKFQSFSIYDFKS